MLSLLRLPTDERTGKQINIKEALWGGIIAGGLTGLYLLAAYTSSVALFIALGGINLYFAMELMEAAGMALKEKDYGMAFIYGSLGIFAAIGVKESFSNASQISMARSTARSMTNSNIGNACRAGSGKTVSKTNYGKSNGKYSNTAEFLTNIESKNGKYYTDKAIIDKIGQIEIKGEDLSLLNKKIMSSRPSTEGGTSIVYKYSDNLGTKYLIHEVTDAKGYIFHRDFDAVRISSGQLINKGH